MTRELDWNAESATNLLQYVESTAEHARSELNDLFEIVDDLIGQDEAAVVLWDARHKLESVIAMMDPLAFEEAVEFYNNGGSDEEDMSEPGEGRLADFSDEETD